MVRPGDLITRRWKRGAPIWTVLVCHRNGTLTARNNNTGRVRRLKRPEFYKALIQ